MGQRGSQAAATPVPKYQKTVLLIEKTFGQVALCPTHVPVHQVQVEVVRLELVERVLDGQLDVLGVVVDLKQLRGDEDLGTGDARGADTLPDLLLVAVAPGAAAGSAGVVERVKVREKAASGVADMEECRRKVA